MKKTTLSFFLAAFTLAALFSGCTPYLKSGQERVRGVASLPPDYKLAVCGVDGKIFCAIGPDLCELSGRRLIKKSSFSGREIAAIVSGVFPELYVILREEDNGDALVFVFDRNTGVKTPLGAIPAVPETAFADSKGRLWLSGKNLDIYRYSPGKWKKVIAKPKKFFETEADTPEGGYYPAAFIEDSFGRVWAWPWSEGGHIGRYYAIGQVFCFEGESEISTVPERLLNSLYYDAFFEVSPGIFLLGGEIYEKNYRLEINSSTAAFPAANCLVSTHYFPGNLPGETYYDRIFTPTKKLLLTRSFNRENFKECQSLWDIEGTTPVRIVSNIDTSTSPASPGRMKHPFLETLAGDTIMGTQGKGLLVIGRDKLVRHFGLAEGIKTRDPGALFFDTDGNLVIFSAKNGASGPEIIAEKKISGLLAGTVSGNGVFRTIYPLCNVVKDTEGNIWYIAGKDDGGKFLFKYDGKDYYEVVDVNKMILDGKEKYHLSNPGIFGLEVKNGKAGIFTNFDKVTEFVYDLSGKLLEEQKYTHAEFDAKHFNKEVNPDTFSIPVPGGGKVVFDGGMRLRFTGDGTTKNIAPLITPGQYINITGYNFTKNGNLMIKTSVSWQDLSEWVIIDMSRLKELLPLAGPDIAGSTAKKQKTRKDAFSESPERKVIEEKPAISEAAMREAVERYLVDTDSSEALAKIMECGDKIKPLIEEKLKSENDEYLRWKLQAILESK